jgi:DNA-binding MarR family transcriptional regulator
MKRLNRDAVTAMIVIEMLTEGVYFDIRAIRKLRVSKDLVTRALKALIASGVVTRSRARNKYLLTDEFLDALRQEIARRMPRGSFIHHPDLATFEVCGISDWSADELKAYVDRLTQRWMLRKGFA